MSDTAVAREATGAVKIALAKAESKRQAELVIFRSEAKQHERRAVRSAKRATRKNERRRASWRSVPATRVTRPATPTGSARVTRPATTRATARATTRAWTMRPTPSIAQTTPTSPTSRTASPPTNNAKKPPP